jgi:hypothetical protein
MVDDAIRIFTAWVERNPDSEMGYATLGYALGAACRREETRESYRRASELAAARSYYRADEFVARFDEMSNQISAEIEQGVTCTRDS